MEASQSHRTNETPLHACHTQRRKTDGEACDEATRPLARPRTDGRTDGRGWNPESLERPERKKSRLLSFFSPPISAPLRPIPFFRFALFTAPLAASQSAIGIRPVGNPASIRQREKLVGRSVGHGVVVRKSVGRSIEKSSFSATEAERNCLW